MTFGTLRLRSPEKAGDFAGQALRPGTFGRGKEPQGEGEKTNGMAWFRH
jgi:hypothetical protein